MEIGGIDKIIPTKLGDLSLIYAVDVIRKKWPQAVYENPDTAEYYDSFALIPFEGIKEIFVYRDAHARENWDAEGYSPENCNTMLYLLHYGEELTVVIDEEDEAINEILEEITLVLNEENEDD